MTLIIMSYVITHSVTFSGKYRVKSLRSGVVELRKLELSLNLHSPKSASVRTLSGKNKSQTLKVNLIFIELNTYNESSIVLTFHLY